MSKGGMGNLMNMAQQAQKQMPKLQEQLAEKTSEAGAGGGMVTATVNGKQELISIRIEKDVVDPQDVEMLQDLIVAAVNEALRKAQEMITGEMNKITGGMNIPGLF